jgi:hypothetical protein
MNGTGLPRGALPRVRLSPGWAEAHCVRGLDGLGAAAPLHRGAGAFAFVFILGGDDVRFSLYFGLYGG